MSRFARLRGDLQSVRSETDGAAVYTVKDPVTGTYFRLREPEFWLISQLNGERSSDEVAALFHEKFNLNISPDAVEQFVATLEKLFFLEDGRSEQELARAAKQAGRKTSLAGRLLFVKIKGFSPGQFLERLTKIYRPFHSPISYLAQASIIITGLILLGIHAPNFTVRLAELFNIASVITVVSAIFIMLTLHEFAHAVACRLNGGQVKEMGFLLMYFQPCFYCDLSDAWLFKKKSQRMAVTWAGPYFQFIFLAIAVIIWRMTVPGTFISEFARICAIVSWVTFLLNFNPLIKLDGYYLLSDWLDIPNLRQKSFAYIGNVLKRRVLGWPVELIIVSRRERRIFLAYAFLAFLYSALLVTYSIWFIAEFLISQMGGLGLVLLAVALGVILKQNVAEVTRGTIQHVVYMKRLIHQPVRLTIYTLLIVALIILLFLVPFPHRVTGDVTVQPLSEFTISVYTTGILEATLRQGGENPERNTNLLKLVTQEEGAIPLRSVVSEGQFVKAGDTLAIITSNTMNKDLVSAVFDVERLSDQLKLLQTLPKKEQIQQAEAQVVSAQTTYDQALRDLKRVEGLAQKEYTPQERLESARTTSDVAKAVLDERKSYVAFLKTPPKPEEEAVIQRDIDKAQSRVDFYKAQNVAQVITSPINGIVTVTKKMDALLTVIDNQTMELLVPVSDFDINLVKIGQPVRVKARPYPGELFWGKVVRLPRNAIEAKQGMRFPVAVTIDNTDGRLRPGMTGYAKIEVGTKSLAGRAARKVLSVIRVEFWSWWLW